MSNKKWSYGFIFAAVLAACPSSTTSGALTTKGWRYYDGCNTTTCYGEGNYCTTTLVYCPVAQDLRFLNGMPPCDPAKPLSEGESCSFGVQP